MKHTLRNFFVLFFALPIFSLAQQNVPAQQANVAQRDPNCPGVPGACGFISNQNASVQRGGPQTPQNGNGTLGVIFDMQKCGLDYATAT